MRELLIEYRKSKKGLNDMLRELKNKEREIEMRAEKDAAALEELELIRNDKRLINSMMDSTSKIINWIETGVNPYFHQGVDAKYNYDITRLANMDTLPDITDQLEAERPQLKLAKEKKKILQKVFNALSERERDCVILHIAHGYSMSKTGEMLGISKDTVNTHVRRAKKKIEHVTRL